MRTVWFRAVSRNMVIPARYNGFPDREYTKVFANGLFQWQLTKEWFPNGEVKTY